MCKFQMAIKFKIGYLTKPPIMSISALFQIGYCSCIHDPCAYQWAKNVHIIISGIFLIFYSYIRGEKFKEQDMKLFFKN